MRTFHLGNASAAVLTAAAVLAFFPERASAIEALPEAWEVEYTLSARLQLSDTPMGKGDGVYPIGPGRIVLRFEDRGGRPGGDVQVVAYEMHEHVDISTNALFWSAHVVTDSHSRATPDGCGVEGRGGLAGTTLTWHSALAGYRTDGTMACDGSLCGKFGAPPPGRSPLRIEPHPVMLKPFQFAADMRTFVMPSAFVAHTEMPKQTAHIALAGREVRRTHVQVEACR